MTQRLDLDHPYRAAFTAEVVESAGGWCALARTAFYPGGGGQPPDRGQSLVAGAALPVSGVREDEGGRVWHEAGRDVPAGCQRRAPSTDRSGTRSCAIMA